MCKPAASLRAAMPRRRNSRGQHSHGLLSVLRMSPRQKCSGADPSAKSTRTSAFTSGTIIRSPAVPNGVSQIGPNAVCIRLECVQPMPLRRRDSISRAGKPLPRTWPAMSQVPTKTSSSRSMMTFPLLARRRRVACRAGDWERARLCRSTDGTCRGHRCDGAGGMSGFVTKLTKPAKLTKEGSDPASHGSKNPPS